MRVISGQLRGRPLKAPPGRAVRPTQSHVRQVLFDIVGASIEGARALDLFAGVGGLGIEALSRGAAEVCFIEKDPVATRFLRANLEALDLTDRARVLAGLRGGGAADPGEGDAGLPVDLRGPAVQGRAVRLAAPRRPHGPGGLLDAGGTLVFETSRRAPRIDRIEALERVRSHPVGETTLEFYRWGSRDGTQGDLSGNL